MPTNTQRRLAALATRQHGLVTWWQARGLDASPAVIRRWVRDGRLERVHRGVYRVSGARRTPQQDALAACLAAQAPALASHATAARLIGLGDMGINLGFAPARPEIIVPRGRRAVVRGVVVHEARDLLPSDSAEADEVPVTAVVRTIIDLAPRLDRDTMERLLDEVLRRRIVTVSRLVWRLERTRSRRTGVLRELLAARVAGVRVRDSDLEKLFSEVIDRGSLPEPVPQHEVRARGRVLGRIDFAYPEVRVGIELDGGQHLGVRQKREDTTRQNRVQSRDWVLLRFYRAELQRHPEEVCAEVARAVAARALALGRRVPRAR